MQRHLLKRSTLKQLTLLRHFVCLLFLHISIFLTIPSQAQVAIHGSILDADSGESLPAANIQIEGAFQGTISNKDGAFSLVSETFPVVLIVRYIGYGSRRVDVTEAMAIRSATEPLSIGLEPTVYLLEELVITDQDPAISIMRKVIERKQAWREKLEGFQAEAYNRFTLKNDTGIVSIMESFTDTYWSKAEGMREVVKARRQTSNVTIDEYLPAAQFVANLYDDNLDIAGYNFMGVTHPDALDHYRFELMDYRQMDDRLVYDIRVTPRNKLKTAFVGRVAVLDEEYALLEVSLKPGEAFLFPPPIEGLEVNYEQQFSNFGGDFWLPVDFRSQMQLKVGFNRLLSFPTFFIDQVSKISNYEINRVAPDTLFAKGQTVVVDSVSVKEEKVLEERGVAVPLEKAEVRAYETVDSTMTLTNAYQPTGPLARFVKTSVNNSESENEVVVDSGGKSRKQLDLNLQPGIRFNRVEGLYGEIGTRQSIGRLSLNGRVGGSTALSDEPKVSYSIGGAIDIGQEDRWTLDIDYARYTDTQTPSTPILHLLNSAFTLFEETDYFDYYRNQRLHGKLMYRVPGIDTQLAAGVRLEKHRTIEKQTDYDLLGGNGIQRPNAAIEEGLLRAVFARIGIGDEENNLGFAGRKRIELEVEHSAPDFISSNFSFTRYQALLEWRVPTLFKRRLLPNTLDVKLYGQTYSGDLPVQRYGAVESSIGYVNRFGALRTANGLPYRGRSSLGLFWEHNFRTIPFEILGLNRLAQNAINIIVFGGHGRTWNSSESEAALTNFFYGSRDWHHEAGISLSGVFSLFRIDFAKRLDAQGYSFGISTARIF